GEPAYENWGGSRFRYTGQIMLPEAKLYHYKARVYDPVLGRFLQTDPVGYKDGLNLYAYVGNDPLSRADPTGQLTIPALALPVIIVGVTIGAGCNAAGSCERFGEMIFEAITDVGSVFINPIVTPYRSGPTTLPIADELPTVVTQQSDGDAAH